MQRIFNFLFITYFGHVSNTVVPTKFEGSTETKRVNDKWRVEFGRSNFCMNDRIKWDRRRAHDLNGLEMDYRYRQSSTVQKLAKFRYRVQRFRNLPNSPSPKLLVERGGDLANKNGW